MSTNKRKHAAATIITDDKQQKLFYQSIDTQKPVPNYTSFITRNAALVAARTTNSQLQTEGDGRSLDLKKEDNKELLAILGPDYSDQFKSPYDTIDLIRYHEVMRDDGIAAASIDFLIQFILGDHFKTIIDVNAEFDTEEEAAAALEFFTNNPQIRAYKRKLDQINRELKFQIHMFSLLIQCMGFGRACGLIEKSDVDGLPIAIKVLPSMHLGQIYVHRKTWEVLAVEHLDFKFPASIIKAQDMIYFCNRNHNISPGTFQYGYSLLERVSDLSELNRITNQRNLKEINYRLWAAFLLVKMPGSYDIETMKKLASDLAKGAGNSIVINQPAEVEVHEIGHDMEKLIDQRNENYREIIRQLQVPIILFDPDILNRATSQELMEAWTASVLKVYRSWYKDIVQDQWNNPIIKTLIENERKQINEEGGIPPGVPEPKEAPEEPTKEQDFKVDEQGNRQPLPKFKSQQVIPPEAIDPKTGEVIVYRLPWKIKIELEPPSFDTQKEKAEMAILLKNNGLATIGTALKMMGVTDENELAQLIEMEEERRRQNLQMQGAQVADEQEAKVRRTGEPVQTQGPKPRSLERQKEKFRDELRSSLTGKNVPTKTSVRPKRVGIKRTPS